MNATITLRIAAVLTLLYCAGHTLGMPWTPVIRPQDIAVPVAMKAHQFDVTEASRTYWDFYVGFGLAINRILGSPDRRAMAAGACGKKCAHPR